MKATRLTLILTVLIAGAACTAREAREMRPLGPDSSVAVDGGSEDSPVAPTPLCTTESGCEPLFFVFSMLDVGMADPAGDPEVVPGTNVDATVTPADADPTLCTNKKDFKSPPPDNESGVDNQFAQIIASLTATGSFDVSGNIEASIGMGLLLVLIQIEGVDDPINDPHVEVNAFSGKLPSGVTAPVLGSDGRLQAGQTFDIDPGSLTATGAPLIAMKGRIDAGRLSVEAEVLPLVVALGPGIGLRLNIRSGEVRFTLGSTGLGEGVIGGGLVVEEVVTAFEALMVSGVSPELLRAVLDGAADLEPDADGFCQAVSTGFVFAGVPALRGLP